MRGAPARYGYAQKLKAKEKRKKKRIFFRWIVLTMSRYGAFFSFFFSSYGRIHDFNDRCCSPCVIKGDKNE